MKYFSKWYVLLKKDKQENPVDGDSILLSISSVILVYSILAVWSKQQQGKEDQNEFVPWLRALFFFYFFVPCQAYSIVFFKASSVKFKNVYRVCNEKNNF